MMRWLFESAEAGIERKLKEEHDRQLREDSKKVFEEEARSKQTFISTEQAKHAENVRANEAEIEEKARKGIDEVKTAAENYQQLMDDKHRELADLQTQLKNNAEQNIEALKTAGVDRVELEKGLLQHRRKTLQEKDELLTNEIKQLADVRIELKKERSAKIEKMNVEEKDRIQKHHKEMHELHKEKERGKLETETKLIDTQKSQKAFVYRVSSQKSQLQVVQMSNAFDQLEVHIKEQSFEDFRKNCKDVMRDFTTFTTTFNREESDILTTRDQILYGEEVTDAPDFVRIKREAQKLWTNLTRFSVDVSTEKEKFETLQKEVLGVLETLKTLINEMKSRTESYCKRKNPQPQIDGDGFEMCQQGSNVKETALKRFDITEKYGDVKKLIHELSDKMSGFNVPASTAFNDTLSLQFEKFCVCHEQIINQPITDELPTTSTAKVQGTTVEEQEGMIEDAPDE